MSARRELTMRQLRQMLRLHHDGVSAREIGRRLGLARSTIQDNLKRAAAMGLGWPLPAELTDDELERRLFMRPGIEPGQRRRSEPDWAVLARELKRPGVNLMVLWEEYRDVHRDGYGYRSCYRYAVAIRESLAHAVAEASPKPEFFVMQPRSDRGWDPHVSYHFNGKLQPQRPAPKWAAPTPNRSAPNRPRPKSHNHCADVFWLLSSTIDAMVA